MGQMLFASLFQTGCARECYSNCNSKATEFVNNGSNINGKFTSIKNILTNKKAPSSKDNTQCCCSTMGIQIGVSNLVWCSSSQMCHKVSQMMVLDLRILVVRLCPMKHEGNGVPFHRKDA